MKKCIQIALASMIFLAAGGLYAQSYLGKWTTVSDEKGEVGKKKSHVLIYKCKIGGKDKVCGKIVKLLDPDPKDPNPICSKCTQSWLKDKPIKGLGFMYNLEHESDTEAEGGRIVSPSDGKTYSCKIEVAGGKLQVRGFMGISLIGRTQTWLPGWQ